MELFLSSLQILLGSILLILGILLVTRLKARRGPYPLPPGPPGEPLLGHFRLIPTLHPEDKYIEWGKKYGGSPGANIVEKWT